MQDFNFKQESSSKANIYVHFYYIIFPLCVYFEPFNNQKSIKIISSNCIIFIGALAYTVYIDLNWRCCIIFTRFQSVLHVIIGTVLCRTQTLVSLCCSRVRWYSLTTASAVSMSLTRWTTLLAPSSMRWVEYYLYYIATRSMLVSYLLRNGWTDLAIFFFVSSVLVRGWFLTQKILYSGSGFPGNPENPRYSKRSWALVHYSTFVGNQKLRGIVAMHFHPSMRGCVTNWQNVLW